MFEEDSGNKKQKFEFDLFSLEPPVFKKLEAYVQKCVAQNEKEAEGENKQNDANKGKNDPDDDVQHQIDQKLRENKMSLETEILDNQNFAAQNFEASPDLNQPASAPTTRKLYDLNDPNQRYMEDRYLLIGKINKLENKQLRGIVPIVK